MENQKKQNTNRRQTEKDPVLRQYQDIVDRAHKEVEWVRSAYKWLVSIVGIVIVSGLFFLYWSAAGFKTEMKLDSATAKARLSQDISVLTEKFKSDLDNMVHAIGSRVDTRVEEEFKKEHIQLQIQENCQKRIDNAADLYISQLIEEKIKPKIGTIDRNLKALNEKLVNTSESLEEIKTTSRFTITVLAALNDDRQAFDQLRSWLNDNSFALSKDAENAFVKLRTVYGGPIPPGYLNAPWKQGVDPSNLRLSQLRKEYTLLPSLYHADLVNHIWKRNDLPKGERMRFLIDVLKKDESLTATFYAGQFFAKEAGLKWSPFVIQPLLDWWGENKENIT